MKMSFGCVLLTVLLQVILAVFSRKLIIFVKNSLLAPFSQQLQIIFNIKPGQ